MSLCLLSGCHGSNALPATSSKAYAQFIALFYQGVAGLQVGDDVRAEDSLAQAVRLAPGEPAAWADWGVLALRQRNFDAATERLSHAAKLAPNNDQVEFLLGQLESERGDSAASVRYLQQAVQDNPGNLRAMYELAAEIEREGEASSEQRFEQLMQQILAADPNNLAALLELSRIAAKRGDAATLRQTVAQIAHESKDWPPEVEQQLAQLQAAAAGQDVRPAATRSIFLRNVLMRVPQFRNDLSTLKSQPGESAQPMTQLLRLQNPPSRPAPPDRGIQFVLQAPDSTEAGVWNWAGAIALNGNEAPVLAAANGKYLHLNSGANLPFPGGPESTPPGPEGVLAIDFNYDFMNDLVLAGAGGIRFFRQDSSTSFTDVTKSTLLPEKVVDGKYTGAWALDIEADGDLDILLGAAAGPATVLRNNGDGTFATTHPFAGISGVQQLVWVDLNDDGNPDAAIIDGDGKLHLFLNLRSGNFVEANLPIKQRVCAIAPADLGSVGALDLIAVTEDGALLRVALTSDGKTWTARPIARVANAPAVLAPGARLYAADVDNNGAVDLILTPLGENAVGALLWLQDENSNLQQQAQTVGPSRVFAIADLKNDGHLALIGLSQDGRLSVGENHDTKDYRWQIIRPRARVATGDQRVNPFGIGGEIEVRAGLLLQKLPITSPELHFGLGEEKQTDVARILWPNGSVRAEFNLKSDQQIVTEQRLKGSCPFLFAWNGQRMSFVKDSVPWGSAIGLRINALGSAKIAATEEWYKIGHDQLVARDGFYDLRITGELWETYYYDSMRLMTVDHPIGTEVFTDERYDVPPVKLAVTAMGELQPIAHATDDRGHDVTAILSKLDGVYLDTFGRGQYQGITRDHYVEVDLPDSARTDQPLWLVAKGWLHPSDSSINVAMSQGRAERPHWLSLEVPDGHGGWRVARPNLGFPAGRNKICLIDLNEIFRRGILHRVRLCTNLEIYWDSIEWAQGKPATPLKVQQLAPAYADLHYRGFSTIHQANDSSPEIPAYDQLSATSKRWRDLEGYYTRFGDVRELLASTDDRYVIMNAGDELALRFAVPAPPPEGWVRDFVIAGDGWIKDGDFNSSYSQTVMPYPYHARKSYDSPPTSLEEDWVYKHHPHDWEIYQTRYVTAEGFSDALKSRTGQ